MTIRDLIPWNRGRDVTVRRGDDMSPLVASSFLTLHREMNRLFDDVFRGFDLSPIGFGDRLADRGWGWPNIEVSDAGNAVTVTAELPGLEEKDVDVHLAGGILTISGEKKTESDDKERLISERYYGRFERRIPVEDVDQDKVNASFKNGMLTVTLPRLQEAKSNVKRIAINGK